MERHIRRCTEFLLDRAWSFEVRFRKSEYSALDAARDAAIEPAQRFWAGILCNTRVDISDVVWLLNNWVETRSMSRRGNNNV